jgi:ElaA protein
MLSAQANAQEFYRRFGFTPVSDTYDDGGIPHLDMRREG